MVLRVWARKARLLVGMRAGPGRQTHCTALHCTAGMPEESSVRMDEWKKLRCTAFSLV
jgi:SH3-like domain-containing protein